jgi:hypothetical protein
MVTVLRLSILGLVVIVFSLTSPCQAIPAVESDANAANNLAVGAPGGIIALKQFVPGGILPDGNSVGQLEGVVLDFTMYLNGGRYVLDNENAFPVLVTKVWIGGTLGVVNDALGVHFERSPLKQVNSVTLAKDVGTNPYDGQWPDPDWSYAVLDLYSNPTELDKLAVIIQPGDPAYSYTLHMEFTDPADLAKFTGTGQISFTYNSLLNQGHDTGGQDVHAWPGRLTFNIEAHVLYVYAGAPEPATMGLLAAAFAPVLLRRRKRQSRLP